MQIKTTLTTLTLCSTLTLLGATAQAADVGGMGMDAMKTQAVDQAVDAGAGMAKDQAMGAMGLESEVTADDEAAEAEDKAAEAEAEADVAKDEEMAEEAAEEQAEEVSGD